jgi:hypothetical protein
LALLGVSGLLRAAATAGSSLTRGVARKRYFQVRPGSWQYTTLEPVLFFPDRDLEAKLDTLVDETVIFNLEASHLGL